MRAILADTVSARKGLGSRRPDWSVHEVTVALVGEMTQEERWTQVATASSQVEAEMLRDLLLGEGIASRVQTNDASAYLGVISMCRLLVREPDVDRAAAFLDAWETGTPEFDEILEQDDVDAE